MPNNYYDLINNKDYEDITSIMPVMKGCLRKKQRRYWKYTQNNINKKILNIISEDQKINKVKDMLQNFHKKKHSLSTSHQIKIIKDSNQMNQVKSINRNTISQKKKQSLLMPKICLQSPRIRQSIKKQKKRQIHQKFKTQESYSQKECVIEQSLISNMNTKKKIHQRNNSSSPKKKVGLKMFVFPAIKDYDNQKQQIQLKKTNTILYYKYQPQRLSINQIKPSHQNKQSQLYANSERNTKQNFQQKSVNYISFANRFIHKNPVNQQQNQTIDRWQFNTVFDDYIFNN